LKFPDAGEIGKEVTPAKAQRRQGKTGFFWDRFDPKTLRLGSATRIEADPSFGGALAGENLKQDWSNNLYDENLTACRVEARCMTAARNGSASISATNRRS
jgi:hypothetical protein